MRMFIELTSIGLSLTDGWGLSNAYGLSSNITKITFVMNRSVFIENANDFFCICITFRKYSRLRADVSITHLIFSKFLEKKVLDEPGP